ncbi:MAG: hypothetical protein A3I77_05200 [Gammaproteobacteria bacterium RIFCSPLOWO2_02_FULL_42_14]|nr:MAG: hypothetical protein A3B71_01765 [Gammaproteobacteria bacterium RIFCSPHIGHO2_02_FULL_42_43]OGT29181.1 MAG: hypothetical protein A2624_01915 [Gammaproteobacteria bacterium RIFCSPHIGHO2_01_FULL_42_8]OGT51228.1 MAG: hypothetical protein A3E54_02955 [Gammaproteobacteria bacterium RIFCSPHIGHO2_12_FULL_41_25]OGT62989.1 MAG: hypothetical protein A3I77_05200 [Gammaproteobacteria bacterium RIFCSPLOWO2_02_FULL_42_14]OGT86121.1 MAG: hypothetical protein A3G86_02755 [Gammaproteobacteria bacterium R
MMIGQHGANLTEILQLANQLHALPLSSVMADQFIADGNKDLVALGGLQGVSFEKAYVNAMVTGHEGALHLIDTQLMQTATTPEIKKFMIATRAAVAMHLEHAKKLQQAEK